MNRHLHLALYRRLTTCYPRTFRVEYGEDLTATFELQLREHGPSRCWLRTLQDLIITVPIQHLESRMKHPTSFHVTSSRVTVTCLTLAIAGALAAIVTGSLYAVIFLLVALLAVAIAVMSRKATKPVLALENSAKWKKFLAAGTALLAIIIVLLNVPPNNTQELSAWAWSLMAGSMLLSFTLIGAGVVLGVARLSSNRHQ